MLYLTILEPIAFVLAATYVCRFLLEAAQLREDREDERLWHYILHG